MKLILGTVQFGLNYGISNSNGVPNDAELKSILAKAKSSEINMLDTANAYGNAEERLGLWADDQFKIVTKFSNVTSEKQLEIQLENSLEKLNTAKIYGYLAHNADLLIENPKLWTFLQKAKANNKIQKVGYSLYHPEQLQQLLTLGCLPDLVQLPYSILDRKFETDLTVLKELGVEIHVRSVFLQGLYFMRLEQLPSKLQSLKPALALLKTYCDREQVSVAQLALNFVVANPQIDKVVVGVETAEQLRTNLDMIANWQPNEKLFSEVSTIEVQDKTLLNPANW